MPPTLQTKPTKRLRVHGDVNIQLYGKPLDFRYRWIGDDPTGESDAARADLETLQAIAEENGLTDILVPNLSESNTRITPADEFEPTISIGNVTIHRGVATDGVILPPDSPTVGALFRTADCHTTVVKCHRTGEVYVLHTGRNSLVDHNLHRAPSSSRDFDSVVQRLMTQFASYPGCSPEDLSAHSVCGIRASMFKHPFDRADYGTFNEILTNYIQTRWGSFVTNTLIPGRRREGCIDVRALVQAQFREYNVRAEYDTICTASDLSPTGAHQWHSHR
ncbi:MAG: hypothetical protein WD175_01040, partial [Candidatus Paceibacterota bacterium]